MEKEIQQATKIMSGFQLGEGPVYMDKLSTLFWVDIEGKHLHTLNTETNHTNAFHYSDCVSAIMPFSETIIIALIGYHLCYVDIHSGKIERSVQIIGDPTLRFNDAKCDQYGNIWAGTMKRNHDEKAQGTGSLLCIKDDKIVKEYPDFTTPNGMDWIDGDFYHIDTEDKTIYRYTVENEIDLTYKETFLTIDDKPDGMTRDNQGNLYVALWGSGKIIKVATKTKEITPLITTDTIHSSCLCFGGKDLKTIFITSAEDADGLKNGALYSISSEAQGVGAYPYKSSFPFED